MLTTFVYVRENTIMIILCLYVYISYTRIIAATPPWAHYLSMFVPSLSLLGGGGTGGLGRRWHVHQAFVDIVLLEHACKAHTTLMEERQ